MADGQVLVIGSGPAGLMAAEAAAARGVAVDVVEAMPSVGRKFLLAGKSGLNITHAEPHGEFLMRFGAARAALQPALDATPGAAVRAFAEALGSETFVGSSGRVFPRHMKASPLLRNWLRRLSAAGVRFHLKERWTGIAEDGALVFSGPEGEIRRRPAATVLALGGASWPRLGSDGGWTAILAAHGVPIAPLRPANCGFDVAWSQVFAERAAGQPVKTVTARVRGHSVPGEFVITRGGIEGGLVYQHAAALRDMIEAGEPAVFELDLLPGRSPARLAADLLRPKGKLSFSSYLRKAVGLEGVKAALVRECLDQATRDDPARLAVALKALPIQVVRPRPIAEAISSAGGIRLDGLDERYMIRALPGIFAAGEMLDWEAPTGGYLISASLATGRVAGEGAADFALGGGASA